MRESFEGDTMKYHPLSGIFPLLEGAAFDELVADVKENGVREPIWLYQQQILDGRNRFRAAEAASREAPTREYTGEEPLKFVLSLNLHRRHLTESQRSMVAARIATMQEGRPSNESVHRGAVSQEHAAEVMKVSRRSVQRARKVIETAAPEVVRAIDRGELRVKAAAEIGSAPKDEQIAAVQQGKEGVKQLRKKIKASGTPSSTSKQQQKALAASKREEAVQHLFSFVRALRAKEITPQLLAAAVPLWFFQRDSALLKFIRTCVALGTRRRKRLERQQAAWLKKSRAAALKFEKKKAAKAAAAKHRAARKVRAKPTHTRKRIRTAKAPVAVRRPARRSSDTKQRRSAKPQASRVSRRLSHSSVSA
jgi:hypothetical protein